MKKVLVSWSSGKDCALSLHEVLQDGDFQVVALLTTVSASSGRIGMHHVPQALVEKQAESIGIPLEVVSFSPDTAETDYETSMRNVLTKYQEQGVEGVVSGDIFLDELKEKRESNLARIGMKGFFPLWKRDTTDLANTLIDRGFKAVLTCVDTDFLDDSFLGREIDASFLKDLPNNVDPCGEHGEFHSFVYDGPIFKEPLTFKKGMIHRFEERYPFLDLAL